MITRSQTRRISSKKSRNTNRVEHDYISNLPDCVISHILSRLPTKEAVSTSALSRDWKFKWTSIYKIDIVDGKGSTNNESEKANFVSFVERTLLLTHNVQSFCLSCRDEYDLSALERWISAAFSRSAHYLNIYCPGASIVLSHNLLNCDSLRELYLGFCPSPRGTLKVSAKICFDNLKTLMFSDVEILNENSKSNLVKFNFPLLDRFTVVRCKWSNVKLVEIYAPKMTYFHSAMFDCGANDYLIRIIGDNNHLNFEFSDLLAEEIILFGSPVVYADLKSRCRINDLRLLEKIGLQIRKLLKGFSSLGHLELSGLQGEAIVQSKLGLSLPKMTCLTLYNFGNTEALLELLHAAPYLKFLYFELVDDWNDYDYDAEEYVPSCIVSHLEKVSFNWFAGTTNALKLVKFFLKNVLQLKRMSIGTCMCWLEKQHNDLVEQLSTCPKASASLILDF